MFRAAQECRRDSSCGRAKHRGVGGRMRQLRAGTTQEEFARVLGISQAQLSKYELGQSAPPLGVLIRLAEKCCKSTDWILTGRK
jgi:transcriptional regulator with XRE-family HTH domain